MNVEYSLLWQFVEKLPELSFRSALGDEESRIALISRARFLSRICGIGMTCKGTSFNKLPGLGLGACRHFN